MPGLRKRALRIVRRVIPHRLFRVVSRIPESHLLPEHRVIIIEALDYRRGMISDAIAAFAN